MPNKTEESAHDIQRELDEMETEIARLEAEAQALPPVPSWDELQEAGAIEELRRQDNKRQFA